MVHGAHAVHVQTICTPPLVLKLSEGCKWHRVRICAETYTITYPNDTPNIDCPPCPCLSLGRLQHVREVGDLIGV